MSEPDAAVRDQFARHVNPTFAKLLGVLGYGRVWVRAEGATLVDDAGVRYVDLLAGFGSMNLGHSHPELLRALAAALAASPVHVCHTGATPHEAAVAARLAAAAGPPFEIAMMSSTGAEAVEAAIKLARAATRRAGVLSCDGGFHGLSLGTLSIMGATRLRAPFEPLVPGTQRIPFGDVAALAKALAKKKHAAFVVEPIQAEAGVVLPPPGYLAAARELCTAHGTLLVFDEVQTGIGRTGARFAFHDEKITPDLLVLAKALGGGVVPVGATLCSAELHRRGYGSLDRFDAHGSTFAGNPLACAAAIATLDLVDRDGLAARSRELGERLIERLTARIGGHPLVRAIRGRGLLVGVEVGTGLSSAVSDASAWLAEHAPRLGRLAPPPFIGQWFAVRMLEAGYLCQPAAHAWDVLKLEPPLTIEESALDGAVDALARILEDYRSAAAVLRDVGARMASRGVKGWAW
ncbi:MAG: aminotransferase class III-fold pyridoxal phosphate-dependent enzyme [Deltaproteobacteria bacterium]|nr:aminotransferase class III-fold pyridoxal phosphate-dependent enzyme [Deltaproteobacteria bacterium]